ncbi:MAG: hypothetical protein U1D30_09055 [Planctomycetota bacterium]
MIDEIVGKSIDFFHKNPAMQRKIFEPAKNLPHADIQLDRTCSIYWSA